MKKVLLSISLITFSAFAYQQEQPKPTIVKKADANEYVHHGVRGGFQGSILST